MIAMPSVLPIGRVVATESKPSTPHQFYFRTEADVAVGIGSLVRVDGEGRTVYAVITDALAYDNGTGEPARLFLAAVLRQLPESPLQAVPIAPVHLASEEDVGPALRMEDRKSVV